jgi:radical SAM-linked protein
LQYTKRGKVRWISNRDVARAFTEGFSPRPKVSFGLALSTGYESDAEYLDVEFASEVAPHGLPAIVSEVLPPGIDVVAAGALVERAPALMDAVTSVVWSVVVADDDGTPVERDRLESVVHDALAMPVLETLRRRKGREVVEDVKPVISAFTVHDDCCTMELRTQPRSAKPGDVLAAIASAAGLSSGLAEAHVLRTHQWIERDGARHEPLRADTRPRAADAAEREGSKGLPDVQRPTDRAADPGVADRESSRRLDPQPSHA